MPTRDPFHGPGARAAQNAPGVDQVLKNIAQNEAIHGWKCFRQAKAGWIKRSNITQKDAVGPAAGEGCISRGRVLLNAEISNVRVDSPVCLGKSSCTTANLQHDTCIRWHETQQIEVHAVVVVRDRHL